MARFSYKGSDELARSIMNVANFPQSEKDNILKVMADVMMDKIRVTADSFAGTAGAKFMNNLESRLGTDHISISFGGDRFDAKHKHGTREAEIAFLNEFGVPSKQGARPFMQEAIDRYSDECVAAGQKAFDDWMSKNGL